MSQESKVAEPRSFNRGPLPTRVAEMGWFIVTTLFVLFVPDYGHGIDWYEAYLPATHYILEGSNPYLQPNFFNPPWVLYPLIIPALLPRVIGRGLVLWLSIQSFAYVLYRLGASQLTIVLFLLSPFTIMALQHGNLEWLVLLGVVLPPWLGLFLVLAKPHLGMGVALLWAIEAWRAGGVRAVLRTFAPFTVALLLSFAFYGLWPLQARTIPFVFSWNWSLYPYSIPVGFLLLWLILSRSKQEAAIGMGACFSPYLPMYSVAFPLLALVRYQRVFALVFALTWALILVLLSAP